MTVKELTRILNQEKFDVRGVPVYLRKQDVGCWDVVSVSFEDSGVYIDGGEESNPEKRPEDIMDMPEETFG